MLMNENSELRSLLRLSKNFSKNIINKSIKNNIVLINNDGGVKASGLTRGFIPSTFGVTLSYIYFSIYIFSIITTYILFYTLIYILSIILICIFIYILLFIVTYISSISSNHISIKIFGISFNFGVTLSHIKFSLFTKTAFLINSLTNIIFSIPINIVTLSHINFLYTFSFSSSFVALYTLFTLSSFMSSLSQSLILSLIFVCTFSLSSSLTALAAPFLLSSFVLPIIVLLKSPTAFL